MKSLHGSILGRESTWGWGWALWPRASCLEPGWWCCTASGSGSPGPSFQRGSALLQREREEGEQRLSKLRWAQFVGTSPLFVVPTRSALDVALYPEWLPGVLARTSFITSQKRHETDTFFFFFCLGITKVFWPWCWGIVLDILADRPFITDIDLAGQHWGLLLVNL